MNDRAFLRTAAENATEAAGSSLARSLYVFPVTIGLSGALGTGKTTFLRGFLEELGVALPVTSPTYALEQRYETRLGDVLHMDLYRLNDAEARDVLRSSADHEGIRCIEWPERAGDALRTDIRVAIEEPSREERTIAVDCSDVDWPDDDTIDAWRTELRLPPNVSAHCDAVGEFCVRAADALIGRGIVVRRHFARAAGRVHDLLRFVDFHDDAAPDGWKSTADEERVWASWKARFPGTTHEEAGRAFLRERGFPALGDLIASHSIHFSPSERRTTEEHLLYYADKRFVGDRLVTIDERYADFAMRYRSGVRSPESLRWEQETRDTERLLFPEGVPF